MIDLLVQDDMFMMSLLFFVSGIFVKSGLERKGRFAGGTNYANIQCRFRASV